MSDYEEEHFPVTIRTSFSSSFDGDWREPAGITEFAPIRRSFSEFYRGERITVDTIERNYEDEFPNVYSKEEIRISDDDSSDLDDLNGSCRTKLGSGSSCVIGTKNNRICGDVQSRYCRPEIDMHIDSAMSEHNECENGYDNKDANSETKVVSHAENSGETVCRSDSRNKTGLVDEFVHTQHGSNTIHDVRQRIVSEIRNNIPEVGHVRSCNDSGCEIRQTSPDTVLRGEFARFRKRSPGVAKRLEATTPSQSESVDMSVLSSTEVSEADEANPENSRIFTQPSIPFTSSIAAASVVNVTVSTTDAEGSPVQRESTKHHERSNIVDISQMSKMWDSLSDDSMRRTDPFRYSGMLPDAVLFTTCDDPVADQTIRLSPELTECDSDNVSTLEEDNVADVVNGCLPVVEDGLSCSDTDDMPTSIQNSSPPSNFSSAAHSDVAEMDISHKFPVSETEVIDFFSGTMDSSYNTTRVNDDPVERAIRDIRLAMERSKGFAAGKGFPAGSPRKSQSFEPQSSRHDVETVWVSRAV